MAETTGIGWTDGTVNFWIGCTEAGPGCDFCYAREFAKRKFPGVTWGPGGARHRTVTGYDNPTKWQRKHEKAFSSGEPAMMTVQGKLVPVPIWVFANSLSDFFDNEIDPEWRRAAWEVIRRCPSLRWQLVTKRVGNVAKMLPADWRDGKNYPHVGIICTMVNQDEYDRDAPKLQALYNLGVRWTGISMEPQLGPINMHLATDWVISGGESKQGDTDSRPFDLDWPRLIRNQCVSAGIPFFMKQFGDHPIIDGGRATKFGANGVDIKKWPEDLRIQQMPSIYDDQCQEPNLFGGLL